MIPLINGQAYDFTQIQVTILGVPVASVSAVNYTEEQEKVNNYGAGNRPVSRGQGPIECTASFEISMNDVEAIRAVAPNKSLLQIPAFDIIVFFGNPQNPTTHIVKNCEFTSDGNEASQGDTDIKRTFDLTPSHVNYDG
jgi:hypothetical protein